MSILLCSPHHRTKCIEENVDPATSELRHDIEALNDSLHPQLTFRAISFGDVRFAFLSPRARAPGYDKP